MMQKWKVLSSDYLVENYPYHLIRHDRCQLSNGVKIDSYIEEYPNWVNAVVLTPAMEMVLVVQYRHGVKDFVIETPGGMVDAGETSLAAITREVAEETGYRSTEPPILLGEFYPNPAASSNRVSTYLFLNARQEGDQHLDQNEDIEIRIVPFEAFGQMIRTGQAPQIFAAMGYHLAKDYLARHSS